jgi:hypothetical protein
MSSGTVHFLDCRGAAARAGALIVERYNAARPGDRLLARLDDYPPEFRIWMLEAGVRQRVARADEGGWLLAAQRGLSPAQGSVPGVHHVVASSDGSVWALERGRRLARLDAEACALVAVRAVACRASHMALDARRGRLLLADPGEDAIVAVRASDLAIEGRWPAPGGPQLPLVTEEGVACVTGPASGTLTILRPRGEGYETQTVAVGSCPHDPEATADGEAALVPCAGDGTVVKVRLSDGRIEGSAAVGAGASHCVADRGRRRFFVANSFEGTLARLGAGGALEAKAESGGWAHALALAPDGRKVFVANFLDDTVAVFDADTLERLALLPSEPYAHGLDVSPDGRHLVATGFSSERIRIYDAETHAERARVSVGLGSSHTAFVGGRAFVACSVSDRVAVVELEAGCDTARIVAMP